MSTIRATSIAVPPCEYDQETVEKAVRSWLGPRAERFERVLQAFDRALVLDDGALAFRATLVDTRLELSSEEDFLDLTRLR